MSITLEQVLKAYEYADSHPHKYLRGTTNWCAAVAHALNVQQPAQVAVVMPDNLVSHRDSWISALTRLVALEAEATPATHDTDEAGYWEHELNAMRDMYADLDRLNGVKP